MAKETFVKASKIKRTKKLIKIFKLFTFASLTALVSTFVVMNFVYNGGKFSISLDKKLSQNKGIVLYSDSFEQKPERKLYADDIEYMDNISINWVPENIDTESDGSHNGANYIAYTFYIENQGEEKVDYWYTIFINDVIKDVDEAIRIMIYKNGERTVYAKANSETGLEEEGTKKFYSEDIAVLEKTENFNSGDVDKFTIVVFIEGDDPDCINKIIGGEIKLQMKITGEAV